LGRAAEAKDHYAAACKLLSDLHQQYPTSMELVEHLAAAQDNRALALAGEGDMEGAEAVFQQVRDLLTGIPASQSRVWRDEALATSLLALGRIALANGDTQTAETYVEEGLEL